jgi:sugar/nucleoside kinase (ribokinase family)
MTAVVTLGADGAIATEGDEVVRTGAPRVDVVDATGGGDLFVSAYVWADLRGAPLGHRLAWATLYATLSIREPTAFTGAVHLDELLSEGRARGLIPP